MRVKKEDINSDIIEDFDINKSNDEKTEQIVAEKASPVKEKGTKTEVVETKVEAEVNNELSADPSFTGEDSDMEYTHIAKVTIMLVKNYSLYRRSNDKVLPKRKDFIGSSVYSSRVLSSNKGEIEAYLPNIVGLSTNDPNFIARVRQYFNNIRIPVDELGKSFDVSFHYYKKHDYYRIKKEEDAIEDAFQMANKKDILSLKKALNDKITRMNVLEGTKYQYGYPINVEDYLMYRHCLLYPDVAKDQAIINSSSNIRFYFQDDAKEAEKLRKFRMEVNRAKANYVACLADEALFDAVYTQYCTSNNLPLISNLAKNRLAREIELDKFSTEDPVKFNRIYMNKDNKLMANIELLIARGELIRMQYNQNITTIDGEFIGANMQEAVLWFKNPNNTSVVNTYLNKLKNI